MKKIFSKFALLFIPFAMLFTSCSGGGGGGIVPPRVRLNLPDKMLYICGDTIYVQDGDEVYVRKPTTYSSNRLEVYAKLNLTEPVVFDEPEYAQGYITASYVDTTDSWLCADADETPSHYHANSQNYSVYCAGEYVLRTGYIDVNPPYSSDRFTITQLADETLNIGGDMVECQVWDYIFDYNDTYGHTRYWFVKDSGVFIKESYSSDRNVEPYTITTASVYKTGLDMNDALALLPEARVKYTFDSKYH